MALWEICLLLVLSALGTDATNFILKNNCGQTIWAGIQPNSGLAVLNDGGVELAANGGQATIAAPQGWGGRFWGRTGCNFDASGQGSCATGDCGAKLKCGGNGGAPPVSLAEFTLNGSDGKDNYDVSLVDGFNVEISIIPMGGSGDCTQVRCVHDVNQVCPDQLKVTSGSTVIACKSACEAFGTDEYCCKGQYNSTDTCKPNQYSELFKNACPTSYSYAFDDKTSLFTCTGADYSIGFC